MHGIGPSFIFLPIHTPPSPESAHSASPAVCRFTPAPLAMALRLVSLGWNIIYSHICFCFLVSFSGGVIPRS